LRNATSNRKCRGSYALKSAAKTIHYEWKTAHTSEGLIRHAKKTNDQILMNSALESFLIHARNVCDFLGGRGQKDDILAKDFIGRTPRVRLTYIRKNKKRIHRRIAHLSCSRPRLKREWATGLMIREIDSAMHVFVERLKTKHMSIARRVFDV
jgi:hypothetical protein